ncbi:MAG TPA: gluconate kinase [Verrucomicrobiales bacterium]|nr:gluconate kinase [Verrucomicrobiales bacterium]
MGVSGSGKSTVGARVAERLGWEFHDGDSFHPPENVAKMRSGTSLTDEDRRPWLLEIQRFMRQQLEAGRNAVIACSALKQSHRELLLTGEPGVQFVHLQGSKELIAQRLQQRRGHFMPPELLDSQFKTLERPTDIPVFDISGTPEEIAEEILSHLKLASAHRDLG